MKRLLKGVFELRPPTPRYAYIWDANVVLEFLKNFEPNQDMPLSYLTYKLVMLLALATAQRAQTLHSIRIDDIVYGKDLVIIPITGMLKHSTPRNRKLSLHLREYKTCAAICVVQVLKEYVKRTESLRLNERKLFISFHKPHAGVSKTTISRWIKSVLEEAGIDTNVFTAHSAGSAACAQYTREGLHVDEILKWLDGLIIRPSKSSMTRSLWWQRLDHFHWSTLKSHLFSSIPTSPKQGNCRIIVA